MRISLPGALLVWSLLSVPASVLTGALLTQPLSELSLEDLERRRAERRLAPPIGLDPAGEAQRR